MRHPLPLLVLAACQTVGGVKPDDTGSPSDPDTCTAFADVDGDGYGDAAAPIDYGCAHDPPAGFVEDATDCDDSNPDVHPGAEEICNGGVDDDCDPTTVESDDSTWYRDFDGDTFGDREVAVESCETPKGYVLDANDCDDTNAEVHPGAEEVCNGLDDDCSGVVDEGMLDSDLDGVANCVDDTVWSEDFDDGDWTDWAWVDLGGGNAPAWAMSEGALMEASNDAISVAYGPDLSELDAFTITVEVMIGGANVNTGGLVFAWEDAGDYAMVRWQDPTGDYGTYPRGGNLDLYACVAGSCASLGADDGTPRAQSAYGEWVQLGVSVDGDALRATWEGIDVAAGTFPGTPPVGPGRVGVWTDDADGGVWYDDLSVTQP